MKKTILVAALGVAIGMSTQAYGNIVLQGNIDGARLTALQLKMLEPQISEPSYQFDTPFMVPQFNGPQIPFSGGGGGGGGIGKDLFMSPSADGFDSN